MGGLSDQRWNIPVFFGGSGRRLRHISLLALSQQRDRSLRSAVCRDLSQGDCLDHYVVQKNSPRRFLVYAPPVRPSRLLFGLGHYTLSMSYILHMPLSYYDVGRGEFNRLQSPLSLTSSSEFHFHSSCGNKTLENGLPEGRPNGAQEKSALPKYCRTFRMGLLLIVRAYSLAQLFSDTLSRKSERRDMLIVRCKV